MICISDLISERKWTRNLIRDFLGEPDESIPNPYYPTSHPVKLYTVARVTRLEGTTRFISRMNQINKQRISTRTKI